MCPCPQVHTHTGTHQGKHTSTDPGGALRRQHTGTQTSRHGLTGHLHTHRDHHMQHRAGPGERLGAAGSDAERRLRMKINEALPGANCWSQPSSLFISIASGVSAKNLEFSWVQGTNGERLISPPSNRVINPSIWPGLLRQGRAVLCPEGLRETLS